MVAVRGATVGRGFVFGRPAPGANLDDGINPIGRQFQGAADAVRRLRPALATHPQCPGREHYGARRPDSRRGARAGRGPGHRILEQLQTCANRHGDVSADDVSRVLAGVQNGLPADRASRRSTSSAPAGRSARGPPARRATSRPSARTTSSCVAGRRAPARPTWPWPWPWPR